VLLFTRSYADAVLPFQVFSLILLHRVTEYGGILRAAGDTRGLWLASLVLLGGNIVLSLPLTLAFGMVGTAAGAVVANLLSWVFALARIARIVRRPIREVFPWAVYLRILAVAAGAAALTALAGFAPGGPLLQLAVRGGLFTLLFLGGVLLFRLHRRLPGVPAEPAPAWSP